MHYSFDVNIAEKYGVNEAIVINNFYFWYKKNKANNENFIDGRYWTYNSVKAMQELFPFWSQPQIKRLMANMVNAGIFHTGCYNKLKFDRTTWYSLSDEVLWFLGETITETPFSEIGEPIPIIDSIINKDNNGVFDKTLCENDYSDKEKDHLYYNDSEFNEFVDSYFSAYKAKTGNKHPGVYYSQLSRCWYILTHFIEANGLEWTDIYELAGSFFRNVKQSDHNINHFCTEGILKNRMHECGLGGYTGENIQ